MGEKPVELATAAVKRGNRIIPPQKPWFEKLHSLCLLEKAWLPEKRAKFGKLFWRGIQARAKLRPIPVGELNTIVLKNDPFGIWEDPVHDELRDVHADQFGGAGDDTFFVGCEAQVDARRCSGCGHSKSRAQKTHDVHTHLRLNQTIFVIFQR